MLVERGWIYFALPPETVKGLSDSVAERIVRQAKSILENLFMDFLAENMVKKYSVATIQGDNEEKLLIFPLSRQSSLIVRVDQEFSFALETVITAMGIPLHKKTIIPKDQADLVKEQDTSVLAVSIDLHKQCGFGELTESWANLTSSEKERTTRETIIYEKNINRICREIIVTGVNPFDVISNLRKYCRSKADNEIAQEWENSLKTDTG
jgi:hypothetical protein